MAPSEGEISAKLDALAATLAELKDDIKTLQAELGALSLRVAEEYLTKAEYRADLGKLEERNAEEHSRLGGLPTWATLAITILGSLVTGLLVYSVTGR